MIDKGEDFLISLFIRSEKNLRAGADIRLVDKMVGIDHMEGENIRHFLKQDGFIDTSTGYGNTISLTSLGLEFSKEYLKNREFRVIKFNCSRHVPPGDIAAEGYIFEYDLIDKNKTIEKKAIRVMASDVLIITWKLDFSPQLGVGNAEQVLLQIAKDKITEKLKEGSLIEYENYLVTTSTSPKKLPYNVRFLPSANEAEFVIFIGEAISIGERISNEIEEHTDSPMSKLAISIIELRDQINAVFNEKFGSKLLLLNEERAVVNLFKKWSGREGYHYNLNSLAELARNMNVNILRELTAQLGGDVGSVQLLKLFAEAKKGCELSTVVYLKQLGNLRQGYPSHVDNDRVIAAHAFFNFRYPIPEKDFESAGMKLLELYEAALKDLFDFIVNVPKGR